jgi:AraC family transcriptional regulator of adaptative response / DNA-3-methyladenine glycosylase II
VLAVFGLRHRLNGDHVRKARVGSVAQGYDAGMIADATICYRAVLARDARYDGVFFTCVRTTRIYCRPICPARTPRFENCRFVPTAAAAQEAGYRPCLRCRPESSPGMGVWRGSSATVSRALRLIDNGTLDKGGVDRLAEQLGIGERQLRRLFRHHVGAAPVTVAQTRRVLLAKQFIHETRLPMTEVALASGFGSVRRFNETFQELFGRPPSELRRQGGESPRTSGISLMLSYRPPYDWDAMLSFLRLRAIPDVEWIVNGTYSRVIEIDGQVGTIRVSHEPQKSALRADVCFPNLSALAAIIARIRRMFDLGADPVAIGATLVRDKILAPLVKTRPGLRLPGAWDGFEIAVRAILGQQITVRAATQLAAKLVTRFGRPLQSDAGTIGLKRAFPQPQHLAAGALADLGMPRQRARSIEQLAVAAQADHRLFEPRRDLAAAVTALTGLSGIGEWTAQYIAMRGLSENDAFLADDVALQRILSKDGIRATAKDLLSRAEHWRPWRAYAVVHLWTAETTERLSDEGVHYASVA